MSTDGVNYSVYKNTTYADCSVSSLSKGIYYFYVTAVTDADYDYDDEDNYYYIPAQESEPSNIVSATLYTEETYSPMLTYSSSKSKMKIEWSCSSSSAEDCDGFVIYRSKNGGEYQKVTTVSSGKYSKSSSGTYTYKYSQSVSSSPATYKYVVASYAVINGVTYSNPDYSDYSKYTIYMPDLTLTTKTNSEVIKWKKVSGADSYVIYGGASGSQKIATVSSSKTSYTVKNVNNYKKDYTYYVVAKKNGEIISSTNYASSSDGEARMRAAKRSSTKKTSLKMVNVRTSKTTTLRTVTISSSDRKILDDFAKKHFKKGWTAIKKAEYTLEWIHSNVTYATGSNFSKISSCSYVEAIFKKKLGQCAQYNGAYAMFLTYLGYEARIVQGWRGTSMSNKWSHYWCEIKVDGQWYLMETGNEGKSGSWQYFCQPYRNAGGYLINKKVAK